LCRNLTNVLTIRFFQTALFTYTAEPPTNTKLTKETEGTISVVVVVVVVVGCRLGSVGETLVDLDAGCTLGVASMLDVEVVVIGVEVVRVAETTVVGTAVVEVAAAVELGAIDDVGMEVVATAAGVAVPSACGVDGFGSIIFDGMEELELFVVGKEEFVAAVSGDRCT
jgi:hypothetical protein